LQLNEIAFKLLESAKEDSVKETSEDEKEEETPEVDINISNVVCNFSTRCHLNLRQIATRGFNVVYKREQGVSLSIIGIFKG